MKGRKVVSLIIALIFGLVLLSSNVKVAQATSYTTTTLVYYYYTTDPNAGPLVINGITYLPCSTLPSNAQTQYIPLQPSYQQPPQQVYQPWWCSKCNAYHPYGQKCPYENCWWCSTCNAWHYNGQTCPRKQQTVPNPGKTTYHNNNSGINAEATLQTDDLRWYGAQRGWYTNWKTLGDTDTAVKRSIEFKNSRDKFTVEQHTAIQSAGSYATTWTLNGSPSSKEGIQQRLEANKQR